MESGRKLSEDKPSKNKQLITYPVDGEGLWKVINSEDIHRRADGSEYYEPSVRADKVERSHYSPNTLIKYLQQELLNTFNASHDKKTALNEAIREKFRSLNISIKTSDFFEYSILHAAGCFPLTESIKDAIQLTFDHSNREALLISVSVTDENIQDELNMLMKTKAKLPELQISNKYGKYELSLSYELAIGHLITNPIFIARSLIRKKKELANHPEFKDACYELLKDLKQFASLKKCVSPEVINPLIQTLNTYTASITQSGMFRAVVAVAGSAAALAVAVALNRRGPH